MTNAHEEEKHKLRVRQVLAERGWGACMNDTRWREIQAAIATLPFPPPYQRKDVLHAEPEPPVFEADVWYWGDWQEGLLPFFSIEWLRIRPRYLKPVARLLPESLVTCEAELEGALNALGQAYVKADDSIWIHGYR